MHPRAPKLLEDIRSAAEFVKSATDGLVLQEFKQNRMLRQAVERNFEIIGEAMRRLEKDDSDTAARIRDYRRIIAFRKTECVWESRFIATPRVVVDKRVLLCTLTTSLGPGRRPAPVGAQLQAAVAWRTACSQRCISSAAAAGLMEGSKRRSICHSAEISAVPR